MAVRTSLFGALAGAAVVMLGSSAPSLADPPAGAPAWGTSDPVLAVVGDTSCQTGTPPAVGGSFKASDYCAGGVGAGGTTVIPTLRWRTQSATAAQIEAMQPDLVALLGDEQYQVGRYEDFMASFDHTYGAFKYLHRPSPGNHEFYTAKSGQFGVKGYGYFDYYNGYQIDPTTGAPKTAAVDSGDHAASPGTVTQNIPLSDGQAGHFDAVSGGEGWYSYNLGKWHIISLNIECNVEDGGCDPNGAWFAAETAWLAQDLTENTAPCTVAYWHQPTFSAGNAAVGTSRFTTAEGTAADDWWKLLYQHGADLVLNGHDHLYARYKQVDPNGVANKNGIREFIVGTGGEALDTVTQNNNSQNIEKASAGFYGVMKLTLHPGSYDWDYESVLDANGNSASKANGDATNFSDVGTAACHRGSLNQNSQF
ncbi:MAG TPA: metallophosphoesterase [Stellaceae bacterium]|jgi:hypothetical protein|nr:metallophosphoesterase [Stellaceae bacterium]